MGEGERAGDEGERAKSRGNKAIVSTSQLYPHPTPGRRGHHEHEQIALTIFLFLRVGHRSFVIYVNQAKQIIHPVSYAF